MESAEQAPWSLLRQDDNGNRFEMARFATREAAERAAEEFQARGHKQLYYVEPARSPERAADGSPSRSTP